MSDDGFDTVQSVRSRRKDGTTTIGLEVKGDDSWRRAKDLLEAEAERLGVDRGDVTAVEATIEAGNADAADEPEPSGRKGGGTNRMSDDDRSLGEVTPTTSYHELLTRVADADGPVKVKDVSGDLVKAAPTSGSSLMAELWKNKLVDGDRTKPPYEYWLSDHGRAYLDEYGPCRPEPEGSDGDG